MKSPHEYGLPEKYERWRPVQVAALEMLSRRSKRTTGICAPTGSGKSGIVIAHAIESGKPTCIVTATKGLQDQYIRDGKDAGMVDIRGRANYKCNMRPDDPEWTCEDGFASGCPYKGSVNCDCSQAEIAAASSNLVVTNYSKWYNSKKFGLGWDHIQQVVFDEGDEAPAALADAMQVFLYHREIERDLELDFPGPPENQSFAIWKAWSYVAKAKAEEATNIAKARITGVANPKPSWVKHFNHMKNLMRRLAILVTACPEDWVVDEKPEGWQFDPIRPARYAEGALLFRTPNIILVSATLRPKTMNMLGMSKDHFEFKEFDSDFDPSRCPIYYVPTMRVDSRAENLDMLWMRIDQVVAKRQDRKGLIDTVSYARRDAITSTSRFAHRMIINEKGEPTAEALTQYREAGPGAILISPVFGRGYDFPKKDCEWIIMCKIPFEPPSKIVKAREALDREYRSYQAMQKMVQTFGRGMRSKDDRCECMIFDDHMQWFLPRYGHLAPKSFHRIFKQVDVLPQPPERLV